MSVEREQIAGAIKREEVLAFDYPSSVDGRSVRRQLSPWSLEKEGTVVMGWDHGRDHFRRYALAKITDAEIVLSETFIRPAI